MDQQFDKDKDSLGYVQKEMKQIKACRFLLGRLIEEDYQGDFSREEQDHNYLFYLLKKYIRYWWV